jgi:hypothetical protein
MNILFIKFIIILSYKNDKSLIKFEIKVILYKKIIYIIYFLTVTNFFS